MKPRIASCLAKRKKVFIHCWAGVNRAPTIVVAYLVFALGEDLVEAFKKVQSKRGAIIGNYQFRLQLAKRWSDTKLALDLSQ